MLCCKASPILRPRPQQAAAIVAASAARARPISSAARPWRSRRQTTSTPIKLEHGGGGRKFSGAVALPAVPGGKVPPGATHIFLNGMLRKVEWLAGGACIDAPMRCRVELRGLGARAVTLPPFKTATESLAHLERLGAVLKSERCEARGGASNEMVNPNGLPVFFEGARKHVLVGPHVLPVFEADASSAEQYVLVDEAFLRRVDTEFWLRERGDLIRPAVLRRCPVTLVMKFAQQEADPDYQACVQAWLF